MRAALAPVLREFGLDYSDLDRVSNQMNYLALLYVNAIIRLRVSRSSLTPR